MRTFPRTHAAKAAEILGTATARSTVRSVRSEPVIDSLKLHDANDRVRRGPASPGLRAKVIPDAAMGKRMSGKFRHGRANREPYRPNGWVKVVCQSDPDASKPVTVRSQSMPEPEGPRNMTGHKTDRPQPAMPKSGKPDHGFTVRTSLRRYS